MILDLFKRTGIKMTDDLRLRSIAIKTQSAEDTQSAEQTLFLALTDPEFALFQSNDPKLVQKFEDRVVYFVKGHAPKEEDVNAARQAFMQTYGSKVHNPSGTNLA